MLTPYEREIVAALMPLMVGVASAGDFADRASGVVALQEPGKRADLALAFKLFDSAFTGLMMTSRLERFVDAPTERKQKRIDAIRTSRIRALRTMYVALQRLCVSAYYSNAAVHSALGYPEPPPFEIEHGRTDPAGA